MSHHRRRTGAGRRSVRLVSALVLSTVGALVPVAAGTARADPPAARIWADLVAETLGGSGFTSGSAVAVRVYDSPGGTLVYEDGGHPTDAEGGFGMPGDPVDVGGEAGVDLVAGMQVEVTDVATATVKTLTLADITFDRLDPVTDTASGRAPAGAALTGLVGSTANPCLGDPAPTVPFSATATAAGTWSLAVGTDLLDVTRGLVETRDADGDATRAAFAPENAPRFQVYLRFDEISVGDGRWDPNSVVTVSVRAADGSPLYTGSAPTDPAGKFVLSYAQHGVNLTPGVRVTVSDSHDTVSDVLTALTWDRLDPATDTGSGTAPPGAPPCAAGEIYVSDQEIRKGLWPVDLDDAGRWSASLAPEDITTDSWGNIWFHGTAIATYLPPRRGVAHLTDTVTSLAGQHVLTHAQALAFTRLLDLAARQLDAGRPRAAIAALRAFRHAVDVAAAAGRLAPARADKLTDDTDATIAAIQAG